jgi:serine/threonine protein kinase
MRYKLIKGTCRGLRYLHRDHGNGPIVHLNLCPSNVLLDENNAPCIAGFDFSKLIGEKENRSIAVKKDGQMYVYSMVAISAAGFINYLSIFLIMMLMFCGRSI